MQPSRVSFCTYYSLKCLFIFIIHYSYRFSVLSYRLSVVGGMAIGYRNRSVVGNRQRSAIIV